MADNVQDNSDDLGNTAGSRPLSAKEDKIVRLRTLNERMRNEERQKKLEEIKVQALNAQKFKQQMELERKQRLEEAKLKEDMRRQQVEQRRRAILDAEKDRLESILRRNQEREARIELKKRSESSSTVFAFGSSVPRMLDSHSSPTSFWGHRKATSTQNIPHTVQLTRKQDAELNGGSKKRAISVNGLERDSKDARLSTSMYEIFHWDGSGPSETSTAQTITRSASSHFGSGPQIPAGCVSGHMGRRRTDLTPTIPVRDSSASSTSRKPFARSPGRAYSMSRLDQLAKPRKRPELPAVSEASSPPSQPRPLSHQQQSSISRSMSHLVVGKLLVAQSPPKPLRKTNSRSMHQLSAAPVPPPRPTRATQLRQQKLLANAGNSSSEASSRPGSSLSQQSTSSMTSSVVMRHRPTSASRHPRPASIAITGITHDAKKETRRTETKPPIPKCRTSARDKGKKKALCSPTTDSVPDIVDVDSSAKKTKEMEAAETLPVKTDIIDEPVGMKPKEVEQKPEPSEVVEVPEQQNLETAEGGDTQRTDALEGVTDMTASMAAKVRLNTEEEAKAALAERRRLAREEAERQAELERLRIEEEARLELERQQREEEQQRILIEQQRLAEQKRLEEAIKEAKKKEDEERLRREEEFRLKLIKEEAERKAKEEADRQKAELQERLKNEEKEREARRKRVEAIMLRTRAKSNMNTNSQEENGKSEKVNGSKQSTSENGHTNTKDEQIVDNIIPVDSLKNANMVTVESLGTDDNINSNNTWQHNTQPDLLM